MKTSLWFLLLTFFSQALMAADFGTGDTLPLTQFVKNSIRAEDYITRSLGTEMVDGHPSMVLEAVAKSGPSSRKLRYKRIKAWVDVNFGTIRKATIWGKNNRPLVTIHVREYRYYRDKVVASRVEVINHVPGKKVIFRRQARVR